MTSIWDRIFPTSAHKKRELTPEEEIHAAAQREIDERAAGGSPDPGYASGPPQGLLLDMLQRSFSGSPNPLPAGMAGPAIPQALTAPVNSQVVPKAQSQAPAPARTPPAPARPAPVQQAPVQAPEPQPQALQPSPEVQVDPSQTTPQANDVGLLGRMLGYGDQTPDARGLTAADRSQMGFNQIGQMGALLLAAGQPISPGQRAQVYAQMGNVAPQTQQLAESLSNSRAWRQYQGQRAQALIDKVNAKSSGGGSGPFAGTGMDQQAYNIVLTADPNSPEYAAAYAYLGKPKEQFDSTTGRMIITQPNMSWARPPGGRRASTGGTSSEEVPGMGGRFNQDQGNAAMYADRIRQAETHINHFANAGMETYQRMIAAGGNVASNYLNSDEFKRFDQASRNFINATLRRESGAAIADTEFENARRQYMPQPGDSPELLKQKAENRATVLSGMSRAAGPSYRPTEVNPTQSTQSRQLIGKTADGRIVYVGPDGQRYVE